MEEKKIDNLIPLIEFLMEFGNVIEEVALTKNFGVLFNLMDELFKLKTVEWSEIIPELKNLDNSERKELEKIAIEKFDLQNDNIEFIIEEIISILLSVGYLVERCLALKRKKD